VLEALEPLGSGDELDAERRFGVDLRKRERVRDLGRPEEDAADGERRDDEDRDRALQNASPETGSGDVGAGSSASTCRLPSSTGAAYGYRSVRRNRNAYVCAL